MEVRILKRMYTIPAEVAKMALESDPADESRDLINWFGLRMISDTMLDLDASMFKAYCASIFSITAVPEGVAKRVCVRGKARPVPKP